jgi:hypothetical protein
MIRMLMAMVSFSRIFILGCFKYKHRDDYLHVTCESSSVYLDCCFLVTYRALQLRNMPFSACIELILI